MSRTDWLDRNKLIGETFHGYTIMDCRYEKYPKHQTVLTLSGHGRSDLEHRFSYHEKNPVILDIFRSEWEYEPKERVFILGNGPSLADAPFDKLVGETCYAVNRIWKLFDQTDWRPTHYVRGEMAYVRTHISEDFEYIAPLKSCKMHIMAGLRTINKTQRTNKFEYFSACENGPHEWHLPDICAYGTVVNIAMQIAVRDGAQKIYLLGCDLGDEHFYDEKFDDQVAYKAHAIAAQSCPVPIFNATPGGRLDVYPRVKIEDLW